MHHNGAIDKVDCVRFPALIPLLISMHSISAFGQDAWSLFLEKRQNLDPLSTPWTLALRPHDLTENRWRQNDEIVKLVVCRDLQIERMESPVSDALWKQRNWGKEEHWVLLDPAGKIATDGLDFPTPKIIHDQFEKAKYTAHWARRKLFLQQNPHHGEAWLEQLNASWRLAVQRILRMEDEGIFLRLPDEGVEEANRRSAQSALKQILDGSEAEAKADQIFAEVAEALEALALIPDGFKEISQGAWTDELVYQDARLTTLSPRTRKALVRLQEDLEFAIRREPVRLEMSAGILFMRLQQVISPLPDYALPRGITALPGRDWPSQDFIEAVCRMIGEREDWVGMLNFLSAIPERNLQRPLTLEQWNARRERRVLIALHRAWALGQREQWDDVRGALREARRHAGPEWNMGEIQQAVKDLQQRLPELKRERLESFRPLLFGQGEALPPKPEPWPMIRLVFQGDTEATRAWDSLQNAPVLALWGPDELRVEHTKRDSALNERFGWGDESRWALLSGNELVATDTEPLTPDLLAMHLNTVGPSRIQELDQLIQSDSEQLDLRRERYRLLQDRMPNKALEERMAEDARLALISLDFSPNSPWKPDEAIWSEAAARLHSDLETAIRRWPSREGHWRTWVSWVPFHPNQPSAVQLLQQTVLWGDKVNWTARMPKEVHEAVLSELRRQRRWEEMRVWFQDAFDGLDKQPLRDKKGKVQDWLLVRRRKETDAIVRPLREALEAQQRFAEVTALDLEWRELTGMALKAGG